MENFWNIKFEGEDLSKFESGGGDFEPIPAKTQVLAMPCEVKWDTYEGEQYISIQWTILQPSEYKNRRIFQKIKIMQDDTKKREKALRMLAAIDYNAKGGLVASGKKPDDAMLQKALLNKPMVLMLQVWDMDGKKGNWISAISAKNVNVVDVTVMKAPQPIEVVEYKEDDVLMF